MNHYLYRLIPSRRTFAADMTDAEKATIAEHVTYRSHQQDLGFAVAFGPVADPAGSWGVAIVEAESEQQAYELREHDPAVRAEMEARIYRCLRLSPARDDTYGLGRHDH